MIILIGFAKAGGSSFYELWKLLGYKRYQYYYSVPNKIYIANVIKNNKFNKKPLLTGFDKNCCIGQLDVCLSEKDNYWAQFDFKQLYEENKDDIFILNKRDPINLLDSWKRWGNMDKRFIKYSSYILEKYNLSKDDKGILKLFEIFYQEVEDFFDKKEGSKFISYDIEKDQIEKLKKYIDIKNVKKLPHINKNIKKLSHIDKNIKK